MPDFRFLGFREGSAVTLSLVQGALTRGPLTIPAWAQPVSGGGTGEVSISTITDGRLVAPTGVWFQATIGSGFILGERTTGPNTYDPSFHEIEYVWTVQRPSGSARTFEPNLNMPTVWNNRNVAYGKQVTIVLDTPGVHIVTCTARDWAGNTGVATWTHTVADPDVAFSGAATICFSQAGNFAGAPTGSQQFTDIVQARNAYISRAGDARFLFRRGETINIPVGWIDNNLKRGRTNLRFGAFGTGAKPRLIQPLVLQAFMTASQHDTYSELCFHGIRLESNWDETTETGFAAHCFVMHQFSTHFLLHQCEMHGHDIAVYAASSTGRSSGGLNPVDPTTIVSETTIGSWLNFGIFNVQNANEPQRIRLAQVGNSIARHPNSLNGRDSDLVAANAHGPQRISVGNVYIGACDMFSKGGWSGLGGGIQADQPCIRILTSADKGDFYVNVERVALEGGFQNVTVGAANPQSSGLQTPSNVVVDRFLTVGVSGTRGHFRLEGGAATLRNGLMIQPGTPHIGAASTTNFIGWGSAASPASVDQGLNTSQKITINNVTAVNLRTSAQNNGGDITLVGQSGFDLWTSKAVENNVVHAPSQPSPITSDGPFVSSTTAGFTPRWQGYRANFAIVNHSAISTVPGTLSPTVAPGGTVVFPYPAGTNSAHFAANQLGGKTVIGMGSNWRAGPALYREQLGQLTVAFTGGGIEITNTSGVTWTPLTDGTHNGYYRLSLDRSGELPPNDASLATPPDLHTNWTPATGSPAIGSGNAGERARFDALLRERVVPFWRGAVQPY